MDSVQIAVDATLCEVTQELSASGFVDVLNDLTRDVWSSNVDRFEPDELGDTPNSLGFQSHQNFSQRALRRFRHDEREATQSHWEIAGLSVTYPQSVLTFGIAGRRIFVMKVPFGQGRRANFHALAAWPSQSDARHRMAVRNSQVLGGFRSDAPGQESLLPIECQSGQVRDFILAWAGEQDSGLTAGWLGVPILGEDPFLAMRRLWWDEGVAAPLETTESLGSDTFDRRLVAVPQITLKPSPGLEGNA